MSEVGMTNDALWWTIRYAVEQGRNGDDPQEVADEMLMDWQMTCAEIRVRIEQERGDA